MISASELGDLLSVGEAVAALEKGLHGRDAAELEGTPRTVLTAPDRPAGDEAEVLLMPAFGAEGAGLKLVTIARGNERRGLPLIQGLYVLLAADGMTPELVVDGAALTGLRTAAVSALATRRLARPDSRRLVVFGAGPQAEAHVTAMRAVLPIERVSIVGSSPDSPRARALAAQLAADGLEAAVAGPTAIAEADVICTCTTSSTPVFDDRQLAPGTHVNAIGAYRLDMAELPIPSLARGLLVVESIAATLLEAGDVVAGIEQGALPRDGFAATLSDVLGGRIRRTDSEQITIFKSVGLAIEDLIVARAVADALRVSRP
jgi:ornithine cyclodeaminase